MLKDEYKVIRRAQKGNPESFGDLYDHYSPQIYRFIFLKVSDKHEAEDLSHEVFLSAWQNIDNYDYRGLPFSSWLYRIARNRVIDHYRARKETVSIDDVSESAFQVIEAIEHDLDQQIDLTKIKAALQQLSEEQQNIIILRFIEDLTPSEIAAIINKSEGAIRLAQHRAIKKLKIILNNKESNGESIV